MRFVRAIGLLACLAAAAQAEEKARPVERYVRIGHYQCMCRQGDFEANLKTVLHGLELAEQARVQIMAFAAQGNGEVGVGIAPSTLTLRYDYEPLVCRLRYVLWREQKGDLTLVALRNAKAMP
jgi:hypothetical protein